MRRKLGVICIILGICCLFSSVGFIVYNTWEENRAENSSKIMVQNIQEQITNIVSEENRSGEGMKVSGDEEMRESAEMIPQEMQTMQVDGYECIGILFIPVLELELPILLDWSYAKLKIAPCHYYGSYYESDFVIAAHNYPAHFGRLSELQPKDRILFTDVSGMVHCYEVVLLETLPGNATEEMISSGFDLSLYTCTPGGSNRVTVRCNAVSSGVATS